MRVGVDYRPALFQAFGIGRYVKNLVAALLEADPALELELLAIFRRGLRDKIAAHAPPDPRRARLIGVPMPARLFAALGRFGLTANRLLRPCDVWHDVDYAPTPVRRIPRVVTLYDVAYFPEFGFVAPRQSRIMLRRVRALLVGDPEIVVISEAARADVVRAFDLDPARVHVTPLGFDPLFAAPGGEDAAREALARGGVRGPYVVALGTLEPRKNLVRLVRAFAAVRRERPDVGLVLLGRRGWRAEETFEEISRLGLDAAVRWLGSPSDLATAAITRGAAALAFPTLHEGFGLPAIEGLAAGTPVVASDIPVLREVCGDAAVYADPRDEAALARALLAALDPAGRDARVARGRERAARFTWRACAEGTLKAYASAVARARC